MTVRSVPSCATRGALQIGMALTSSRILQLTRPGFEAAAREDLAARMQAGGMEGQAQELGAGVIAWRLDQPRSIAALAQALPWTQLPFARETLFEFAELPALPQDRVSAIQQAAQAFPNARGIEVYAPDSDQGKALEPLTRALGHRLQAALSFDAAARHLWHVLLLESRHALLGAALPPAAAPVPAGIVRLRMPREAPSRSTLKLEEALLTLLDAREREQWLKPGLRGVDLGASPGGWTWQLVRHHVRVTAVDNGRMDPRLLDSGLVEHRREDGFRFQPGKGNTWLVCDMVEKPSRVVDLVCHWFERGWCKIAVFNLKLPMKQRHAAWQSAQSQLAACLRQKGAHAIRVKQLYHDREEITVAVVPAR